MSKTHVKWMQRIDLFIIETKLVFNEIIYNVAGNHVFPIKNDFM